MTDRLLISQGEAAQQLGVSRLTLIHEIERGRLRYVLVGQRRKFKPEDLTQYIERQGRGCEEGKVLSHNVTGHRTSTKTLASTVVDFEEALIRTTGNKPKSSRRKFVRTHSSAKRPVKSPK